MILYCISTSILTGPLTALYMLFVTSYQLREREDHLEEWRWQVGIWAFQSQFVWAWLSKGMLLSVLAGRKQGAVYIISSLKISMLDNYPMDCVPAFLVHPIHALESKWNLNAERVFSSCHESCHIPWPIDGYYLTSQMAYVTSIRAVLIFADLFISLLLLSFLYFQSFLYLPF